MHEPYLSEFRSLLASHAASRDVHDGASTGGFASARGAASDAFIKREVERVGAHQRSLVPLLAGVGRAERILDFGCGTGGTTLALALAGTLDPTHVVGVDANASAIAAADVRGRSYRLARPSVEFRAIEPGARLPFDDGAFDLAVSVSVLEFITDASGRRAALAELGRVVRPGGHLFVATPRPWLREYHSGRWLGDFVRRPGFPWSSSARELRDALPGWRARSITSELATMAASSRRQLAPLLGLPPVRALLPVMTRWHKLLLERPA